MSSLLEGTAWEELRRCFPAASHPREPAETLRIDGIAAQSGTYATAIARTMIDGWLGGTRSHDAVFLTPVSAEDGRYSVTVICHPGTSEPAPGSARR